MPQSSKARNPEIDRILDQWALENGFTVQATEHWDAVTRRVAVLDSGGDVYEIYAGEDYNGDTEDAVGARLVAVAGAGLVKRGESTHLAFRRERERFTFRRTTSLKQLSLCLDEAYTQVLDWVAQAGHTLNSRPLAERAK